MMNKLYFILILLIAVSTVNAQNNYIKDVQGVPITIERKTDVNGSPYLNEDWAKATVSLSNGITYKDNMYVKYNQEDDQLYFRDTNQEMLAFVLPVTEFVLLNVNNIPTRYKSGLQGIPNYTEKSFFEVLSDGSVQLLKKTKKIILESKEYNSPTVTKNYVTDNKYYAITDGKVQQFKPDKKAVLNLLSGKRQQIESYIKDNNLNVKSDRDLSRIFTCYNSI